MFAPLDRVWDVVFENAYSSSYGNDILYEFGNYDFWILLYLMNILKNWWRPSRFTVTYCTHFGMLADHYDKFTYNNLAEAQKRLNYLCDLSNEGLISEGFRFIPNYIRIEQVISPNPIRRFLNWCGSKRMYKVFGVWI